MIDIHRMIGRLSELMKNTHPASALGGSAENGKAELLFTHRLRTRECEEDASGCDFIECFGIEATISLKGVAQNAAVLRKRRRVEDYEVVHTFFHCIEILEGIFGT